MASYSTHDGSRMNHGVRMPGIRLPDGNWLTITVCQCENVNILTAQLRLNHST